MKTINDKELNTISKRIKYSRLAKNMTMQELADSIGKKYQTVQQYEKGIRNPKQKMIEDIAKGLKVSPIFLKYGGYYLNEDKDTLHMSICVDKNILKNEENQMYTATYAIDSKGEEFSYDINADCQIINELIRRINDSNNPEYIMLIRKACDLAMKSIDKNYDENIIEINSPISEKVYAKKKKN